MECSLIYIFKDANDKNHNLITVFKIIKVKFLRSVLFCDKMYKEYAISVTPLYFFRNISQSGVCKEKGL